MGARHQPHPAVLWPESQAASPMQSRLSWRGRRAAALPRAAPELRIAPRPAGILHCSLALPSAGPNGTQAQFCTCWGLLWGSDFVAWSLGVWNLTLISHSLNDLSVHAPCMYLWWVLQSCLHCLVFPFVALPAADSDGRPIALLPGCRPVHAVFVPAALPDSIPSHVSPFCLTCSSAAAVSLSKSRTSPPFFHPCAFHSSDIWPPAWAAVDLSAGAELFQCWFHQYILQLSSVPPGSGLRLLCRGGVSHCFLGISMKVGLKPHVSVSVDSYFRNRYSLKYEGSSLTYFKHNIYNP